jgi:hypothetical protein
VFELFFFLKGVLTLNVNNMVYNWYYALYVFMLSSCVGAREYSFHGSC